jgi:hypothetical protein
MTQPEMRPQQIQQIPVFALRQAVSDLIDGQGLDLVVQERMRATLNIRPKQTKRAIQRLSRESLTRLIDACPEINDAKIQELFEEYRYGVNPSFYVYLLANTPREYPSLEDFQSRFTASLKFDSTETGQDLPRLRRIELNDLVSLPDRPEITEGTYRFQSRLDYIDENQNAVSTYETLYGFFWINTLMAYSIIQARSPEVLHTLVDAIQAGIGVTIYPLVVTKEFKNELPFLMRDAFRSGRLYDPNPKSRRFHWVTITDDTAYDKGYEEFENNYPELQSARYRERVDDQKETSLTIRCHQGAFSLAGKLRASQFRGWCLDRLGKLIETLNDFRSQLPDQVKLDELMNAPQLRRFEKEQKEYILPLISCLLILKHTPELNEQPLAVNPLELAAAMVNDVTVQVHCQCTWPDCTEEAWLRSQGCGSTQFILFRDNGQWALKCSGGHRDDPIYPLPLKLITDRGHEVIIDEATLGRVIEIIPGKDLLAAIAATINRHVPGFHFDANTESFFLRGDRVIYYPNLPAINDLRSVIYASLHVDKAEEGSNLSAVSINPKTNDRDPDR